MKQPILLVLAMSLILNAYLGVKLGSQTSLIEAGVIHEMASDSGFEALSYYLLNSG